MSVVARDWARKQRCGGSTLKAVLMAVADYANDRGEAWPSQRRLAAELEMDPKTVREALRTLEEANLIRRERHDREDGSRGADRLFLDLSRGAGDTPGGAGERPAGVGARDPGGAGEGPGLTTFEPSPEPSSDRSRSIDTSAGVAEPTKPRPKPRQPKTGTEPQGWSDWYSAFPRHVGPDKARSAYARIVREGLATPPDLLEGAKRYRAERQGQDPKFTAHPASWLNAGRYRDEPDRSVSKPAVSEADRAAGFRAMVRRWTQSPSSWPRQMGPPPGEPGCQVPSSILAEFRP